MESTPTSILISTNPIHALRITRTNNNNLNSLNHSLYSKPIPPSKRRNRTKLKPNSSPLSSTHSTSIQNSSPLPEKSIPKRRRKNSNTTTDQQQLSSLPALPSLPPTPLTPLEIIQSTTLSRLFKKSNTVFSQIADSATHLIESDLSIGNKLNQLVQLLRGDLNSKSSIQLIQNQLEQQPGNIHTQQDSSNQYHILTQTLQIIQSLFITPTPIKLSIQKNDPTKKNNHAHQQESHSSSSTTTTRKDGVAQLLDVEEQNQIYQASLIQINKFLGDLKDYRERLIELRNGCLAVEKRRRAIWHLIKISDIGFNELLASSSPSSSSSSSSSELNLVSNQPEQPQLSTQLVAHPHHQMSNNNNNNKKKNDQRSDSGMDEHDKKKQKTDNIDLSQINQHQTSESITLNPQRIIKKNLKKTASRSNNNIPTLGSKLTTNPPAELPHSPSSATSVDHIHQQEPNNISFNKIKSGSIITSSSSLDPVLHHSNSNYHSMSSNNKNQLTSFSSSVPINQLNSNTMLVNRNHSLVNHHVHQTQPNPNNQSALDHPHSSNFNVKSKKKHF